MNKSAKTKLIATIISMVCALSLIAVGVMASLTNFQVVIANQLNLEFNAVEGQLFATRVGDVAGTDRTTSKVLSESTNATSWLNVYNGASGVNQTNLDSIQEKINFVSNDKIKDIVNGGRTYVAVTYYFYYVLPENSTSNNVTLTAPAVADENIIVSYSYTKSTGSTLPSFDSATSLTDGGSVTVEGGEGVFIKAEARVNLTQSVNIDSADWKFTLNFGISTNPTTESKIKVTDEPINGNYFYYVELGEYPQTVVEDTTTVSALNALGNSAKTGRTFVVGASGDAAQTEHVEYAYNGAKYVKVASAVVEATDRQSNFSTGTQATSGNAYWFKVEPIKWFLLEAYSATKTDYTGSTTNLRVISEQILASNIKFSGSNANVWGTSNVRAWLNGTFYTNAFNTEEKGFISKNTTRYFGTNEHTNKDDYTVTTGGNTSEDNVWLISNYEAGNTYYGENMYLNKKGRAAAVTDFAIVNKAYLSTDNLGWYWLRSASTSDVLVCDVNENGELKYFAVNGTTEGIRPALTISL